MKHRHNITLWLSLLLALPALACSAWTPAPAQPGPQPTPQPPGGALPNASQPTKEHTVINPASGAAQYTPAVFFAVHIETSDHNTQPDSVAAEWPMLAALVELADRYGHKLTLEFQPQWAEYALAHPEALAQIRQWEAAGHEIAVHHHGVSHPAWDGYTNAPGYQNRQGYRGTMEDAMALLDQLPAEGTPLTGGMTDEETDWPATLIYATGGSGMNGGGLVSTPTTQIYRGTQVTQVNNQGFALGRGPAATLEEIQAAVESAAPGEVIGVVTHPFDFWANQDKVEALFQYLQSAGIGIQTVSTILGTPSP